MSDYERRKLLEATEALTEEQHEKAKRLFAEALTEQIEEATKGLDERVTGRLTEVFGEALDQYLACATDAIKKEILQEDVSAEVKALMRAFSYAGSDAERWAIIRKLTALNQASGLGPDDDSDFGQGVEGDPESDASYNRSTIRSRGNYHRESEEMQEFLKAYAQQVMAEVTQDMSPAGARQLMSLCEELDIDENLYDRLNELKMSAYTSALSGRGMR